MPLPYEKATTGKQAVSEMQKLLRGFGAGSFGVMENFSAGEVIVQFEHRGRHIVVKASIRGYAAAWMRAHPWSYRMKCSKAVYEKRAMTQAGISVYSILRDWIKGQVTAVEVGMLSVEGAFLGQIMLPSGETVLERVTQTGVLRLGGSTMSEPVTCQ
jgi:hypothetical protein